MVSKAYVLPEMDENKQWEACVCVTITCSKFGWAGTTHYLTKANNIW